MKTLTIQEVSKRSGLSTHTLRFWERVLDGIIIPDRTKGGQRRYSQEHIDIIDEIKGLKDKGMSLTDIRREMNQRVKAEAAQGNEQGADAVAAKIAEIVRSTIFNYLNGKTVKE